MKQSEIKVGQTVQHKNGFKGLVTKIEGNDIHLTITDSGHSFLWTNGETYIGLAEYMTLVKDVKSNKLTIDVEVNGLEQLEELAEEMSAYESEQSVFKAKMGHGIEFEGTKSDFETFIDGMIKVGRLNK